MILKVNISAEQAYLLKKELDSGSLHPELEIFVQQILKESAKKCLKLENEISKFQEKEVY